MKIKLIQTCGACPEQYDGYLGEEKIAFLRLRHGRFRAEYKNTVVYTASTNGDGCFDENERDLHLNAACKAILEAHNNGKCGEFYYIESVRSDPDGQ